MFLSDKKAAFKEKAVYLSHAAAGCCTLKIQASDELLSQEDTHRSV